MGGSHYLMAGTGEGEMEQSIVTTTTAGEGAGSSKKKLLLSYAGFCQDREILRKYRRRVYFSRSALEEEGTMIVHNIV